MSGDVDEFLEHHGIKGQKWGVRRQDPSSNSSQSVDVKDLSDEQIKTAIARMDLEQRYSNLISNKGNKPKGNSPGFFVSIGKNFIQRSISDIGSHFLKEALTQFSAKRIKK